MVFKCLKYNGGEGELVAIVIRVVKMTSKLKLKMQRVQIQLQIQAHECDHLCNQIEYNGVDI